MGIQVKSSFAITSALAVTVVVFSFFATRAATAQTEPEGQAVSLPSGTSSGAVETGVPASARVTDADALALAKTGAAGSSRALENAIERGIKSEAEIFSTLYFPVSPPTSPRTFSTFYDDYADAAIRPIEDRILETNAGIIFAILVDRNGYVPSHNTQFSQPRTGNPELDFRSDRTKRIFNDSTGFHAARNREDFLLQTYRRDTGEIVKDMSVPVYVNGRHWGAFRIGYNSE